MSSVCPSVRLSVTLVDQDHIGWKSWKLIAWTHSPTPSLFVAQTFHQLPGEHGEIWGRLEVGWEKMACWSTKVAISLKRARSRKHYYGGPIGSHNRSLERYHPRPPTAYPSPRRHPKTAIAIISGTAKARDFKFGRYIHRVHPNTSREKCWRKGSVGVSRDGPIFLSTPY